MRAMAARILVLGGWKFSGFPQVGTKYPQSAGQSLGAKVSQGLHGLERISSLAEACEVQDAWIPNPTLS